tara:strand:+ start:5111 stop:5401 length:291 start_codon:yes stop_codon:yes gene_type:complete
MPVYKDTRKNAALLSDKHYLINKHLLECYNKIIAKENVGYLIRSHKSFINQLDFKSKKVAKSLSLLQHYYNTKDKSTAFAVLTCSLANRGVFSLDL